MPDIDFKELEKRIDDYFDSITPEQLKKDMKKADFDFYNQPCFQRR